MSDAQMKNLDIQCAELGRELATISGMEEKIINAALAVLEEQGPYAMFLYLNARHSNVADKISDKSLKFLRGIFNARLNNAKDVLEATKHLADSLDDLLFARDLLRTALSYARYHLKAKGDKTP
ncbi:hypothetical protein [Chloroflexus aggregans]|uniref:CRISPR type III-B/RAMP module-associated protein Cmr5 n=1 Tax=Chloroflexus aggregans (strain MD-66 / DSM 9485) TaxID=326427 RepID=B8GB47_CHLAD|nr:hypothetical protein [Chloroflexus aggregans]ACL26647.1 conserved hypothetical protein [Chloroflexus aggregans DSM 9485]